MISTTVIELQGSDTPQTAADKIPLQPEAIFLLAGSFDATLAPQVRSLCARALIPVALMAKALLVDNGVSAGLAAEVGRAAQQTDEAPQLLGILTPGTIPADTNHDCLLKLPAEWNDPGKSNVQLIAELARSGTLMERPVIVLVIGGGDEEKATILRCVRRCWPVMLVPGAGGVADALISGMKAAADGTMPVVNDPDLREILDTGTLFPLPPDGNADDLKRALMGPIQTPGDVLADAWNRYSTLDGAANDKQSQFRQMQFWILALAVIAAFLAIIITSDAYPPWLKHWVLPKTGIAVWLSAQKALHILLVLVPITISILSGYNSRFREGNKWVLLRAAAESIKSEIFRYRTKTGVYSDAQTSTVSSQSKLAAKMKDISSSLFQSEVNKSSIPSRPRNDATLMTFLRADDYLRSRVEDQISYFVGKTEKLYRRLKVMQFLILLAGGAGTFLAAMSLDIWVALTTATATAFTAKLEIDQVENSIVQYNMALTNLRNIESWWRALSPWEKTRRQNINLLVDQAEKALAQETAGWIQQMQSELDKLTERQAAADQQADGKDSKQ